MKNALIRTMTPLACTFALATAGVLAGCRSDRPEEEPAPETPISMEDEDEQIMIEETPAEEEQAQEERAELEQGQEQAQQDEARPEEAGGRTVATVYFDFDSATLSDDAKASLREAVQGLGEGERVRILGFTDQVGPAEYNKKLAEQRAKAVADFLREEGLSQRAVELVAVGETTAPTEEIVEEEKTIEEGAEPTEEEAMEERAEAPKEEQAEGPGNREARRVEVEIAT